MPDIPDDCPENERCPVRFLCRTQEECVGQAISEDIRELEHEHTSVRQRLRRFLRRKAR